jgi:hypothetical protein
MDHGGLSPLAVFEARERCFVSIHAATDTSPCGLRVGLTMFSASWICTVRKSVMVSTYRAELPETSTLV